MENLKIYRIDDRYIRFLRSRDTRVQDNKDRRRPYVGVVLYVGGYQYFVPMFVPKSVAEKMGFLETKKDSGDQRITAEYSDGDEPLHAQKSMTESNKTRKETRYLVENENQEPIWVPASALDRVHENGEREVNPERRERIKKAVMEKIYGENSEKTGE